MVSFFWSLPSAALYPLWHPSGRGGQHLTVGWPLPQSSTTSGQWGGKITCHHMPLLNGHPDMACYCWWWGEFNRSEQITLRTQVWSRHAGINHLSSGALLISSHGSRDCLTIPAGEGKQPLVCSTVEPAWDINWGCFFSLWNWSIKHKGRLFSLGFQTSFLYSLFPAASPAPCYMSSGARPDNPL